MFTVHAEPYGDKLTGIADRTFCKFVAHSLLVHEHIVAVVMPRKCLLASLTSIGLNWLSTGTHGGLIKLDCEPYGL